MINVRVLYKPCTDEELAYWLDLRGYDTLTPNAARRAVDEVFGPNYGGLVVLPGAGYGYRVSVSRKTVRRISY